MLSDELTDEALIETIEGNSRSYQGYWAWRDKPVAERGAVREVLTTLGYDFVDVNSGQDPPDCWVELEGARVSVEHTELVTSAALRLTLKTGRHHYRLWDEGGFVQEIGERVSIKSANLNAYGDQYDKNWLLIVTDEFELSEHRVAEWVAQRAFDLKGFDRVLVALSYHPSEEGGHIPVFSLAAQ